MKRDGMAARRRCEDASHSQSTSCETQPKRIPFRAAFGVRVRPRLALGFSVVERAPRLTR